MMQHDPRGDENRMAPAPYRTEPLEVRDGIPRFSAENDYTRNYEAIARDHLESFHRDGSNPFIPEEMWLAAENSTAELVRRHVAGGRRILDVGVGMGRLLSRFPDLERYGMDISFGYLRHAQRCGIEVCYAMIEDMPYREEYFDAVVCTDVLEHVLDLNLCVRNILRPLKRNGLLFVRTPYREGLEGYTSPDLPYEYVHLRSFDEHSLTLLFTRIFRNRVLEHRFVHYEGPKQGGAGDRLRGILRKARGKRPPPVEINVVVQKL